MSLHTIFIIHEKHGNCQVKNILPQGGWPESAIFPSGSFHFNSQPRKGADTRSLTTAPSSSHFNSQPRKGTDSNILHYRYHCHHFNSQPRKGTDSTAERNHKRTNISTHSPARGLTLPLGTWPPNRSYFNSQPRKGTDWLSMIEELDNEHFNSQPRKGTDAP